MAALSQEKKYLLAATGFALLSVAVCGTFVWRHASEVPGGVASVELADNAYAATVADAEAIKTDLWTPPSSQTRGRDWVYDTFTPPEIFYSSRTKHFTVKPPLSISEEGVVEEAFGVELVSVRAEPFRLQLIGYLGEGAAARGTFENVATGEVVLGSAGRHLAKLGLTIKSFEVKLVEIKAAGSMTTHQRIASAVVLDDKTGSEVTITHRERHFTGGLSAFVAYVNEAATREVREGETFIRGDVTYRVEKILLSPATIEIIKESPALTQPDRRTLTPRESDDTPTDAAPSSQ